MDKVWREYCSNATIHGIKLATSGKRPLVERIFWLVILIVSTCLTANQVWVSWEHYRSYPLQMVEVNSRTSLMEFEFPAVTICSLVKVKIGRVKDHIRRTIGRNVSHEETESYLSTLLAISLLQFPHYNYASEYIGIINATSLVHIKNEDIPDIMMEVGSQIDDLFQRCTWQGKKIKCSDVFHLQKTEEGFCYSFNSRSAEHGNKTNFVPLKNYLSGRHTGLGITFKDPSNSAGFRKFVKRYDGYNVMVHNPSELPDVTTGFQIKRSSDKIHTIIISPQKFLASDSIKDLPSKVRDCFWLEPSEVEKSLNITLNNGHCHARCRKNAIQKTCNCTPYFFTPVPGVKFCSIEHAKCLADMNVMLRNFEMFESEDGIHCNQTWSCNCVKFCSQDSYIALFSSAPYHLLFSFNEYAHLDVAYFRRWGQTFRKEVKFTFGDLSAAVGGYASLLLGCSLISLLELLYYFFRGLFSLLSIKFTNQKFTNQKFTNRKVAMNLRTESARSIINIADYPFLP